MKSRLIIFSALLLVALFATPEHVTADPIILQNGTATYSQPTGGGFGPGVHNPDSAIDGVTTGTSGWSISQNGNAGDDTFAETAVWETTANFNATALTFMMHHNFDVSGFNGGFIGRFRFSTTSDDRSQFADGLATAGDVTASWDVLSAPSVTGPAGLTFSTLGDNSILVGGTVPATGVVEVAYSGTFQDVTGIRLEALEDPSLPFNGPGLASFDGNFNLSELQLDATAIPEPSTITILPAGFLFFLRRNRRRRE